MLQLPPVQQGSLFSKELSAGSPRSGSWPTPSVPGPAAGSCESCWPLSGNCIQGNAPRVRRALPGTAEAGRQLRTAPTPLTSAIKNLFITMLHSENASAPPHCRLLFLLEATVDVAQPLGACALAHALHSASSVTSPLSSLACVLASNGVLALVVRAKVSPLPFRYDILPAAWRRQLSDRSANAGIVSK